MAVFMFYLLHFVQLLPCSFVRVKVETKYPHQDPFLFECNKAVELTAGLSISDAPVEMEEDNTGHALIVNRTSFTQVMSKAWVSVMVETQELHSEYSRILRVAPKPKTVRLKKEDTNWNRY